VFGGKLTTYRKLAEAALARLSPNFPGMGRPWTADAPLPGAELITTPHALALELQAKVNGLPSRLAQRWATTYGSRVWQLLEGVTEFGGLGQCFSADLY